MLKEKRKLSFSQSKVWDSCQRKWWLTYVEGLRSPETPALKIGKVFARLTEALTKGEDAVIKEILSNKENETVIMFFEKNRQFLEKLKLEGGNAEFELMKDLTEGFLFEGHIDRFLYTDKAIYIRDYKTVSDWRWALTEDQLVQDVQVNLYAYMIDKYHNPAKIPIFLEHQQFNKKTGMKKEVIVQYSDFFGNMAIDSLILTAESIKGMLNTVIDVSETKTNFNSCREYNTLCSFNAFCTGNINLKELKEMFKERSKEEVVKMKPDERLEDLKNEIGVNKKGKEVLKQLQEGASMSDAMRERLKAMKAARDANNVVVVDEAEGVTDKVIEEVISKVSEVTPKPEEVKKEDIVTVTKKLSSVKKEKVKEESKLTKGSDKKVLVLIGCAFLDEGEGRNHPSDICHERWVQPLLDAEKIPHITCSEFSKANKSLLLYGGQILDYLFENYLYINIDFRRPVDALVYQMIVDIDVKKNGKRFTLIRSTF